MSARAALAVSGSNVTGDAPFSCALRLPGGPNGSASIVEARSAPGVRGDLAALVRDLCALHGVRPQDLGEIRVDLGPGSYTGLRVAVTFVRFLQRFSALPVFATDSLSLLATAALGRDLRGRRVRPLLDARRGRFHTAVLQSDTVLRLVEEPKAVPLASIAAAAAGDLVVCSAVIEQVAAEALRGAEILVAAGVAARDLFRPELALTEAAGADLAPHYLMGSYAEE